MPRTSIPAPTRQLVLLEAGYKCANPVCRHVLTLELHHVVWVKDEGSNDPANLVALCPNCHALHTRRHIPEGAIRAWKSMLIALNSTNHGTADILLVLAADEERIAKAEDPAKAPPLYRFTGDGLPALAGLIVSDLIKITRYFSGANYFGGSMPSFEVRLTPRGRSLVDAWREGRAEGFDGAEGK